MWRAGEARGLALALYTHAPTGALLASKRKDNVRGGPFGATEREWQAFIAKIESKAKIIAQDREKALALIFLAGKVAQYSPELTQALRALLATARQGQK